MNSLFATCPRGLEACLAEELHELGASAVEPAAAVPTAAPTAAAPPPRRGFAPGFVVGFAIGLAAVAVTAKFTHALDSVRARPAATRPK